MKKIFKCTVVMSRKDRPDMPQSVTSLIFDDFDTKREVREAAVEYANRLYPENRIDHVIIKPA